MCLPCTTEKVSSEEGRTSGLLDKVSDEGEYDVDEGEESSEEEEEEEEEEEDEEEEEEEEEDQGVLSDYL